MDATNHRADRAPRGRLLPGTQDLDHLDASIVEQLQRDGRRPYRAIAQDLDVPEGTVRFRVNRMLRDEVLHITAMLHPQRLGAVLATLLVSVAAPEREAFGRTVADWEEVMYVSACVGRADFMLQVVATSLDDLDALTRERLLVLPGVDDVQTLIETSVVKAQYGFQGLHH